MSVVDEVKERLDIVEVISSYVQLQKSGRNLKALCPFHGEKTPSFVVFPESQHWHCFGACAEGGDVFTFVMKQEGWDFRTALEELARRAGVELKPRSPAQQEADQHADRLRELLGAAARYYHELLRTSAEAAPVRAYVARRGLSEETVERFLLGYSPSGWDRCRNALLEQGYTIEEQLRAGMLVQREDSGSTYDRFRERFMVPIRDPKGQVIAFGARTLDPAGVPKYINSPQTPVFDKSRTLYGFDVARPAIHRLEQAVIVEGYMDALQAHQAGFTNVVAQMGTAMTEAQLQQLQRYAKRLVLALDPDAAGIRATLRGVEVARETLEQSWEPVFDPRGLVGYEARLGTEIRVLRLPPGKDPDDLIRESPQRWTELVDGAAPVVEFFLQVLTDGLDLGDTKAKAHVVDALLPVLQAVANPVEREDYIQKVARSLRLEPRAVAERLQGAARARTVRPARTPAEPAESAPPARADARADLETHCLATMLLRRRSLLASASKVLQERGLEPVRGQDFDDAGARAIFEAWRQLLDDGEAVAPAKLRERVPAELEPTLSGMLKPDDPTVADELLVRDAVMTVLRLRERRLKRIGQELRFLTLEAREAGDLRATQYAQALQTHAQALLRTQKLLADRWSWTG